MMQDAVLDFAKQFAYKPKIENKHKLKKKKKFIILGMGGSHLAADVAHCYDPSLPIIIHSDYGLPPMSKRELKEYLIIASSYSGNTEEVLSGVKEAKKMNLDIAVISVGGKLLRLAKKEDRPYIELPDTGIQPRSALGFSLLAMLSFIGKKSMIKEASELAHKLHPEKLESLGKDLAKKMRNLVPVIYTSKNNQAIAYNWKIKLNETGKIPAFYNVFPELNHNEMTGFDVKETSKHLSNNILFIFLTDKKDHPKNRKRMSVLMKLYKQRNLAVHEIELTGSSTWEKIFTSLLIADWTAVHIAAYYNLESEQVPMVEEFKKMIS